MKRGEKMIEAFHSFLSQMQIGDFENLKDLSFAPIFGEENSHLNYLTLDEALEMGLLKIMEKEEGAAVPEILAENLSDLPVLILDGEELVGAKQNRTLNTTVLLKEKSKTVIPVSCTEAGRWHEKSTFFSRSEFFISSRIREEKLKTVTQSLKEKRGFRSHQGRIWETIDNIAQEARFIPETGAFREIASQRISQIREYLEVFVPKPGQTGFIFRVRDKIVGMEFLSSTGAFLKLARKILGGFAFDALFNLTKWISHIRSPKSFINEAKKCEVEVFGSVGYGNDLRLSGEKIVGSSLVYGGTVIHGILLAKGADIAPPRLSPIVDY